MKTGLTALGLWVSLIGGISANKDVVTLNTNGEAWIREATATLVVPELPGEVTGDIALWSAIMMDDFNGEFLQGVTQSSPAYVSSFGYRALVAAHWSLWYLPARQLHGILQCQWRMVQLCIHAQRYMYFIEASRSARPNSLNRRLEPNRWKGGRGETRIKGPDPLYVC